MLPTGKKDIWFESSDGRSNIKGVVYYATGVQPFCLLQISHGMCEYIERYADFAAFLTQNGVVVFGNDHIGHGRSAADEGDLGYLGEKDGRKHALLDLKRMNEEVRGLYPGLPLVLLGHSMGSFFARAYAVKWPQTIDGLILSGTGGPNPLAGFGVGVAGAVCRLRGPRHRSAFIQYLAFGSYLKQVENPKSQYDWISRDEEVTRNYAVDPFCNFRFTAGAFRELFSALKDVSSREWAAGVRKDMPVMMFQGEKDPVGSYGKGTATVRDWLRNAGVENLTYRLYPGGRHEMLNEVNKEEVYQDTLDFLQDNYT